MNLEVIARFSSGQQLAAQAASDLAEQILPLLRIRDVHVVLTGGSVGISTLTALAPLLAEKDLGNLHLWWGDERFVEVSSQDRNFVQAQAALLSKISIPRENLHQMPASGNASLEEAAASFAAELEIIRPEFDIVLLGMGQDAHIASLFPGTSPTKHGDFVISEAHAPKPPSQRISLSYAALSAAVEIWFLVSGADKASAVSEVFREKKLPAALVFGRRRTRWYLDTAAAEKLTLSSP